MIDPTKILLFIPTMLLISATPGMCMTLAMSLGMSVGLRRTAWMMAGEVAGVAIVSTLSGIGVASLMLRYPRGFAAFTLLGGLYMGWLGLQMWRSRGSMAIHAEALAGSVTVSRRSLITQGFVTAIANPKGWAFFMALLPPFLLTGEQLLNVHFAIILLVIMLSELLCMTLYAAGGKALGKLLRHRGNVAIINRVAGTLMIAVGAWLILQGR
ncbi:LysE family translocator [Congregibacter variabilis]|uniref:LysE family translocator n=1 Tax=Congregibacter variabilis TaxID=3081200 RepID=A0ABZ0I1E9_9GAMM|nr:LysE family translocator [Congregibacter sp. IMCC43200]